MQIKRIESRIFKILIYFSCSVFNVQAQMKSKCLDEVTILTQKAWIDMPSTMFLDSKDNNNPKSASIVDDSLKVKIILDSIAVSNSRLMYIDGYRILLYTGNSKDLATQTKEKAYQLAKNIDVYMSYKAPMYKVKVGDFVSRLEAKHFLQKNFSRDFPKSTLIQELVFLKKK